MKETGIKKLNKFTHYYTLVGFVLWSGSSAFLLLNPTSSK